MSEITLYENQQIIKSQVKLKDETNELIDEHNKFIKIIQVIDDLIVKNKIDDYSISSDLINDLLSNNITTNQFIDYIEENNNKKRKLFDNQLNNTKEKLEIRLKELKDLILKNILELNTNGYKSYYLICKYDDKKNIFKYKIISQNIVEYGNKPQNYYGRIYSCSNSYINNEDIKKKIYSFDKIDNVEFLTYCIRMYSNNINLKNLNIKNHEILKKPNNNTHHFLCYNKEKVFKHVNCVAYSSQMCENFDNTVAIFYPNGYDTNEYCRSNYRIDFTILKEIISKIKKHYIKYV